MYRQGNGITDHYSLFLRKSRYSACKLYRSAECWLRMFFSCSFFHHFLFSFSFFFRLPFFPPSFMLSRTFHSFELHFNESVGRLGDCSWSMWRLWKCRAIFRNFGKINVKIMKLVIVSNERIQIWDIYFIICCSRFVFWLEI